MFFDEIAILDWSAASCLKTGANSIWLAWNGVHPPDEAGFLQCDEVEGGGEMLWLANPPGRLQAAEILATLCQSAISRQSRLLLGVDFSLGFPAGTASVPGLLPDDFLPDLSPWLRLWYLLMELMSDDAKNRNNRFSVAADLNRRIGPPFLFRGHGGKEDIAALPRGTPPGLAGHREATPGFPAEKRRCESLIPRTQPIWKLWGIGSVGSQSLTGIPHLCRLRESLDGRLQVWPFETGFACPDFGGPGGIVLAEVYPSLLQPLALPDLPKDAGQVAALTLAFGRQNRAGTLAGMFRLPKTKAAGNAGFLCAEEGWILGTSSWMT